MDGKILSSQKGKKGFTLIELLIVIMLLGFLSIMGFSLFQGSQKRSRDIRRKTDLRQVAKALEMYANDYGYPLAESEKIKGCGTPTTTPPAITACSWGSIWNVTIGTTPVVYMQKLPTDPGSGSYCYQMIGSGYKLFAILESDDADKISLPVSCNGQTIYNYVLRSSNLLPTQ